MPISAVSNTTAHPYRTAVSIYVRWSSGAITRASGTMVGANDVLTSAHVVYNPARGTAVAINVIPAQSGRNTPYGIVSAGTWKYYAIQYASGGALYATQAAQDLAIIGLKDNIGAVTGYLPIKPNVTASVTRQLISYPSAYAFDFFNLRQMYSYGTVSTTSSNYQNITALSVSAGSSGGGILNYTGGVYYVTGTVSTTSWGSFINTSRYNTIVSWMSANNTVATTNVTQHFNLGTLTSNSSRAGSVNSTTNKNDRYAFNVGATTTVTFSLVNQQYDSNLYLYDVVGRLVTNTTATGLSTDVMTRTFGAGMYYVEVRQMAGTSSNYTLNTSVAGATMAATMPASATFSGTRTNTLSSLLAAA